FRAALEERTRDRVPMGWAMTQENLALAAQALAAQDDAGARDGHLRRARAHVEAALEVFDPDASPYFHNIASELRAKILAALEEGEV
ncbi:MAG: hypothetical protein AB8B51_12415, partial [Sedimentitalea sp.]